MKCEHRRKKKVYNHGRKGKAESITCKDCGETLSRNQLRKDFERKQKELEHKRRKDKW
jgi:ribosomal protein S26